MYRSLFQQKVVENIINLAKTWTDRFRPKPLNENMTTKPMLIWVSAFSNLLRLTAKEKGLVQVTVVYKRPPTLATMLTNYKKIAHSRTENTGEGRSQPCKKCALCGHFNHYRSMVHQTSAITVANGKIFALNQTLDCLNCGTYVATCRLCHKQYSGQTINKFSKRWCATTDLFGINLNTKTLMIKQHYYTITTLHTKPYIADCFL